MRPPGDPSIPPGLADRPGRLHAIRHSAEEVDRKTLAIRGQMLAGSPHLRAGNFTEIGESDLRRLFECYDAEVFEGLLSRFLREDHGSRLTFRLSGRMTRAAGKVTRTRRRVPRTPGVVEPSDYEIAVSTTILFGSFKDPTRPMKVGGRACRDRLEALQRIFEHELLHLAEFLAWGQSNCSAPNFQALSRRIFGHEASNHELMTPRQEAAETHGIRSGDFVSFEFEGRTYRGRVNRITKRATVLVPDPAGRLYSDGKTYAAFYVPVASLRKETPGDGRAGGAGAP